ncbi:bifunctional 3,4-dihydroxy-2-butanone-4-phosphate synthase/GTP cyclohydrolase II [bacterium]|jgi:3,4-dihydroxy 2-butanone 4-phosphate synthase/GTP cyclohydrolase II|nr:bifunctional 3,4-dihydroxy-2-butanone-4-phosphate synthase/GTP cyclohydrolase II [Gemmatimonadota bacterium]MBE85301.1 bifunctional 3,4-dihydroxy-2-butanone-4-phosphate synthase/GTP cyclohydrolase II [Gemmatimonadota bacterium]MCH2662756.1 bifunctional 3,4-dihydroxy-2-butanone-4-phosphate synthase/GTP cyclohydrolase II [bacterium]HCK12310.1 bifunctional 3,4-dihydroxy-2-butanone-4-phosphate synthase/GTP cyclohydrolase II [Candidatus Latescibacterota bacterium]
MSDQPGYIASIESAIEDIRNGKIVIVVDDEDRENEGDFILAADKVTPESINFMATHGRGLICLPATPERLRELNLDLMVDENTALHGTPFTVSIDAVHNTTTGISANDRCETVRQFVDPRAVSTDFARPGHVFPLKARDGGVLRRAGHTEATVDLARLAGLVPAGVLCEILNADGSMARLPQLLEMSEQLDLKVITIKDLIAYRRKSEKLVHRIESIHMPTKYGEFNLHLFESDVDERDHVALTKGEVGDQGLVLVRMHSECLTGDALGSLRCDCEQNLVSAMQMVEREGRGIIVYMRQEGRGIGLRQKIRAYKLQEEGYDTVDANVKLGYKMDERDYGIGAQILSDLGARHVRLITNNPSKRVGLEAYGIEIVDRVPMAIQANRHNIDYLKTKRLRMGHILNEADLRLDDDGEQRAKGN